MAPPQSTSTAPRAKGKGTIAATHDASSTIRHQQQAKKDAGGAGIGTSRDVGKAVLASPLTVAWPNIPRHLQTSTLHAVRELIPSTIADYHVSRARCHTKEKRSKRRKDKSVRKVVVAASNQGDGEQTGSTSNRVGDSMDVNHKEKEDTASSKRKTPPLLSIEPPPKKSRMSSTTTADVELHKTVDTIANTRPTRPEIMSHLVLGINEVIKSLERQIDELKFRLSMMASALNNNNGNAQTPSGSGVGSLSKVPSAPNHLLPTAPRSPSPDANDDDDDDDASEREEEAKADSSSSPLPPITFIIVPLLSVNPQSLVSPIPSYCATYNALVYQYNQLANIIKTRIKVEDRDYILGSEGMEEIRVVPLGNVESDLAEMVGLRRLACLAIRRSHPNIDILHKLLPKSILHPPRHSLTLPYPLSTKPSSTSNTKKQLSTVSVPIPHVHYSPLHIKGMQTSVPIDGASKKAKRLEEVRAKRVEAKEKKRALREGVKKVPSKKGGKKREKEKEKQKENGDGNGKGKKNQGTVTSTRNAAVATSTVKA